MPSPSRLFELALNVPMDFAGPAAFSRRDRIHRRFGSGVQPRSFLRITAPAPDPTMSGLPPASIRRR